MTPAWLTVREVGCRLGIEMVVKLSSKKLPAGFQPSEFRYVGRPAMDQGDFGPEVGLADLHPVDERGVIDHARIFHLGVVEARGQWFVYLESGRVGDAASWIGDAAKPGLEFSFIRCRDEQEARRFFRHQCMLMTLARLVCKPVAGWVAKSDARGRVQDAWFVQPGSECVGLSQRRASVRLVDCDEVVDCREPEREVVIEHLERESDKVVRVASWQAQARAETVVRGVLHEARIAAHDRGLDPSADLLAQVGEELLPLVVQRLAELSGARAQLMARAAGTAMR